jgi:hypothetical protein
LPVDFGVWQSGRVYPKGVCITDDGGRWAAQRTTTARPGTNGDWRLIVKRGRDGKPGKDGRNGNDDT